MIEFVVKMKNSVLVASLLACVSRAYAISDTLQNILANTHKSNLYTYPTDLTRGIIPVATLPHIFRLDFSFNGTSEEMTFS